MLKLYYDLLSQPSRAIYMLLKKNKFPFESVPLALRKGEHKTPEYSKINAFQLVPVIDDSGFILSESIAILRYLVDQYPDKISDAWYPKDIKKRARVDEYLEWQHINTRINAAMYFQKKFVIPLMTQSPPNEKAVERFKDGLTTVMDRFDDVWLKDKPYITGSHMTFADLLAVCELQQPGVAGLDIFANYPKVHEWFKRVEGEMQPEMDEITALLNKMRGMTKDLIEPSKL